MKIGMFDSGIGGLTVLAKALELMPDAEYLYYADPDNAPYGTKTTDQVKEYSDRAVSFLTSLGAEAVVIACNTATSAAASYLREKYTIPIIGVEPAVKPAVAMCEGKHVLVLATPLTVREKKLHDLIDRVDNAGAVDLLAMPELVGHAERADFDSDELKEYVKKTLEGFFEENQRKASDYSVVVFGCTHFNHFKTVLEPFFEKDTAFIDGAEGTVKNMMNLTAGNRLRVSEDRGIRYFESGREVTEREKLDLYEMLLDHLK